MKSPYDHSTGLSWLWAFLFGPLYFAAHGFWQRAAIAFALGLTMVGIIVWPFMAYPAWRKRAAEMQAAADEKARTDAMQIATLATLDRIARQIDNRP